MQRCGELFLFIGDKMGRVNAPKLVDDLDPTWRTMKDNRTVNVTGPC